MAEENTAESLLLNLSHILIGLRDCKDLSSLSKIDASKNKKLLQKLKGTVFSIYSETEKLKNCFSDVLKNLEGGDCLNGEISDDSFALNSTNILNSTLNESSNIEHFKGFSPVDQNIEIDHENSLVPNQELSTSNVDETNLEKCQNINDTGNDDISNADQSRSDLDFGKTSKEKSIKQAKNAEKNKDNLVLSDSSDTAVIQEKHCLKSKKDKNIKESGQDNEKDESASKDPTENQEVENKRISSRLKNQKSSEEEKNKNKDAKVDQSSGKESGKDNEKDKSTFKDLIENEETENKRVSKETHKHLKKDTLVKEVEKDINKKGDKYNSDEKYTNNTNQSDSSDSVKVQKKPCPKSKKDKNKKKESGKDNERDKSASKDSIENKETENKRVSKETHKHQKKDTLVKEVEKDINKKGDKYNSDEKYTNNTDQSDSSDSVKVQKKPCPKSKKDKNKKKESGKDNERDKSASKDPIENKETENKRVSKETHKHQKKDTLVKEVEKYINKKGEKCNSDEKETTNTDQSVSDLDNLVLSDSSATAEVQENPSKSDKNKKEGGQDNEKDKSASKDQIENNEMEVVQEVDKDNNKRGEKANSDENETDNTDQSGADLDLDDKTSKEKSTKRTKNAEKNKDVVLSDGSDTAEIQENPSLKSRKSKNKKESGQDNENDESASKDPTKNQEVENKRISSRLKNQKSSEEEKNKNKDAKVDKSSKSIKNTEEEIESTSISINDSTSETSVGILSKVDSNDENSDKIDVETKVEPDFLLKPQLKLVDINKLMAPGVKPLDVLSPSGKTRKSVTFDSSVIILTSSDDDENPPKVRQEQLKSDDDDCTRQNSDSDPENPKRRSGRNKENRLKQKRKMRTIEVSDDSSDDSDFELNKKATTRTEKNKSKTKLKFAKLKEAMLRRSDIKRKAVEEERKLKEDRKRSKKHKRKNSSEGSDESDTEVSCENVDPNDPKFHYRVMINLPKFNTEDLSDLYEKKKEVFQVRRCEMGPAPKSKSSKSSKHDKDQPKVKKLKISLKNYQNKVLHSDSEHSSSDEVVPKNKKINKHTRQKGQPESKKTAKQTEKASDSEDEDPKEKSKSKNKKNSKEINKEIETIDTDDDENKYNSKRNKKAIKNNKENTKNGKGKKSKKDKKDSSDEENSSDDEKSALLDNAAKETKSKINKKDSSDVENSSDDEKSALLDNAAKGNNSKKDKEDSSDEENNSDNEMSSSKKLVNGDTKSDSDSENDKQKNKAKAKKSKSEENSDSDKEHSDEESDKETNNKRKKKTDADSESEESNQGKKKKKSVEEEVKLLSGGESEDEIVATKKKKKKDVARKVKKKKVVISDSDDSDADKKKKTDNSDNSNSDKSDDSENSGSEKDEEDDENSKKSRKRIKQTNSSSDDDDDKSTRKSIRRLIDKDSLSDTTKKAEADEKERKARISEKQKKYNQIFELKSDAVADKIILDFDSEKEKELLTVHKSIVKSLKPHQVDGVKFMWDACFESVERVQKTKGSGCILAHCMGLGKTLQVIALSHALLTNSKKTKVEKIMVVSPLNTILNWKSEFHKWLPKGTDFEIFDLVSCKTTSLSYERSSVVQEWHENGGVLIIGYNMFRTLSNPDNKTIPKRLRSTFQEGLVDPGPDLVVCDEGHLLKNEKTNLSIAMNRIRTLRRIVLTGTPLQNNLKEYWCMVQFIKPNLLGTYKEYLNRFVNPIINGQYTDSTDHDIQLMRKRSHVLHKLLDGVVQRQDYCVLAPYLPPKYEFVLFINLTDVQKKLYRHYMDNLARKGSEGSNRTSFLFVDFQQLQRVCTHPRVLLDKSQERVKFIDDEEDSEGSLKDFIDDDSGGSGASSSEDISGGSNSDSSGSYKKKKKKKNEKKQAPARLTRAQRALKRDIGAESDSDVEISTPTTPQHWWQQFIDGDELENINNSGKMQLLFQILKECDEIGDKILVFSQSLYTLNCIEYFLKTVDEASQAGDTDKVGGYTGSWALGLDYFRLDGSSSCDNRAAWCDSFNNPSNVRARLFLISTKAGGLGINLVAANRVIIFDVSWNPSHDIQSIYRVYRFGQSKPCYIYRFVSYGTMEMKIYERQVTKQAISKRVIDEQQIDRHYSQHDIQELYKMDLDDVERPIPLVPKDVLLGEMLQKYDKTIFKYHEHQSLLENKAEECLNEEERKAAWEEFENEKVLRQNTTSAFSLFTSALQNKASMQQGQINASPALIQGALFNIVKKDNPTWADTQIRGILPALVQQLQVQMSENDFSMYGRVQQEIRLIQSAYQQQEAERIQRVMYQRQLALMQQQAMQNKLLGNMAINPALLSRMFQQPMVQNFGPPTTSMQAAATGSGQRKRGRPSTISSEVIDLND